ncbi:prostacyclin receptor isoform X1 [Dendroctonus ponderosae]|uniref:G-protein coupled receptors family 1 profile domain-containing protein n=1 Tax=Dendroctonus ponderosae TaxID=77166 RepID=A0AAR5PIB4_DENPD|nr:prostacyclin receptor isoform X1 [Dendroctonus ponderosae]XP_048525020.1 prostacyclin receptor isoform X1 [Dendroctonus ponderosae]
MNITEVKSPQPMSSVGFQVLITISFVIGIVGNSIALVILSANHPTAKRRNKKHVLMLRWLAVNDLTAAIGMLVFTNVNRYKILPKYWTCTALVLLRGFGLGSGTVALIMALERWFALTRPFVYQKLVTYDVLKRTLCCLWLGALLLTYAPLLGFGLYYDPDKEVCLRYKVAEILKDRLYAWLYFAIGCLVCISIAFCNVAVVLELSKIRSQNRILIRRISRSLIVNRTGNSRHQQTPEEVAFAKLMAYISVIFCLCWGPQIITVPISQLGYTSVASKIFSNIADMFMGFYFTLDPFVYVLLRYIEKGNLGLNCCFLKRRKSTSSIPTTTTTGGGGTPNAVLISPPSYPAPPSA